MGKNIFAIGKYAINKKQSFVLKIKKKKIKIKLKIICTVFSNVYTILTQAQKWRSM